MHQVQIKNVNIRFALESTSAILCTRLLSEFMESVEFFNNFHINSDNIFVVDIFYINIFFYLQQNNKLI